MTPPAATASARKPAPSRLRGLAAVLAGLLAAVVLALLADQLFRALGLPPPGQPMPEFGRHALMPWLRAAGLLLGGLGARPDQAARRA
ncbi:hypothetical protein [Bosea sp. (in: a-proteobacteria)]|uniref:hypothetical protein n=1 Tax=Bosea sp. (in: a-proteobacteria) TaxID=1871050 RepID=UPI002FCA4D66